MERGWEHEAEEEEETTLLTRLREENATLRAVLLALSRDLNIKDEQIQTLFRTLHVSRNEARGRAAAIPPRLTSPAPNAALLPNASDELHNSFAPLARGEPEEKHERMSQSETTSRDKKVNDHLSPCPDSVLLKIVHYLDVKSVVHLRRANRRWRNLVVDGAEGYWTCAKEAVFGYANREDVLGPRSSAMVIGGARESDWLVEARWRGGGGPAPPQVTTLYGSGAMLAVHFLKEQNCLLAGTDEGSILLWSLTSHGSTHEGGAQQNLLATPSPSPVAISPAPNVTQPSGTTNETHPIMQHHHRRAKHVARLPSLNGHSGSIWALGSDRENPGGAGSHLIASGGVDRTIKLWNRTTGDCLNTLRAHRNWISWVALSAERNSLVSSDWDGEIILWNLGEGRVLSRLPSAFEGAPIYAADASFPCGVVVAGYHWGHLASYDLEGGAVVASSKAGWTLRGAHEDKVYAVSISPHSPTASVFATGGGDGVVRVWDARAGLDAPRCVLRPPDSAHVARRRSVMCLQYCESNPYRLVAGAGCSVHVFDTRLASGEGDPAGRYLGGFFSHGSAYNGGTGGCVLSLTGGSEAVTSLALDGDKIFSACADNAVRVFHFGRI